MRLYHFVCREYGTEVDVYSVYSKEIEKRNAITPAKRKKAACKNNHHRQNVHHEVDEQITRLILRVVNQHLPRVLAKLVDAVSVINHNRRRDCLAKELEEMKYAPTVAVTSSHHCTHYFGNVGFSEQFS